ncbi:hypothetical protein DYB38_005553 [Aphanomyces astaci]|uniref:Uncharacterized protein n=1 Tax=Aphanomyces astaci TaxID=112090 RepID=A0A397D2M4_APHAT|nr:hypothetical protein DYB38_005553 [Aphanomyces astaci]
MGFFSHPVCLVLSALAGAAPAAPAPTYTPIPTPVAWLPKPVRSIQARVQSSKPEWNAANSVWVSNFPKLSQKFEDKWSASLDTVNTASVEGALFYVQTEGISRDVDQGCMRKTNMSYIWFYDITYANPYFATAEYDLDGGLAPGYGRFVAMDNGKCTPKVEPNPPDECLQFGGYNRQPNLGPYVGGEPRTKHDRANYPDNYWFSYPGSCYLKPFQEKQTDPTCAAKQKGGMCPRGVLPDGELCTYSFEVLGYISIDDLVGITSMPIKEGSVETFKDRTDFCKRGGIEFDFADPNNSIVQFWNDPLNVTANQERSAKMIDMYAALVKEAKGDANTFKPFPEVAKLTADNPKCWEISPRCSNAAYGCRRKLLAQVCEVCTSPDPDCVPKPKEAAGIPPLVKQYRPPASADAPKSPGAPASPNSPQSGDAGTSNASSPATNAGVTGSWLKLLALFVVVLV